MPTLHELQQDIVQLEDKLRNARERESKYKEIAEDTEQYIDVLRQAEEMVKKGANAPLDDSDTQATVRKRQGKSNAHLYEEILSIHGRPMHITDLLDAAQKLGVQFKREGEPKTQLRNALNGSKKRFCNVGSNMWWIQGKPIPGQDVQSKFDEMVHDQ